MIQISLSANGTWLLSLPGPGASSKTLEVPPDARGLEAISALLERQRLWGEYQPWADEAKADHARQEEVRLKRLPPRDKRIAISGETALALGILTLDKLGIGPETKVEAKTNG